MIYVSHVYHSLAHSPIISITCTHSPILNRRRCAGGASVVDDQACPIADESYSRPKATSHTMGLTDFLKKQFIDIIEWTDDSRDTLSFRFPDEDKEIKRGAQLIVRESQVAQFVYLGEFGDTFGPGKHRPPTDKIPILTALKPWNSDFQRPSKVEFIYITSR